MKIDLNKVVTVDTETYYSTDYSLTKPAYNTSAYVRDPQFKEHCWAIKIGKKPSKCYPAAKGVEILKAIDWSTHYLLAHNVAFDGFILAHHYGIVPHFYLDTLSMTRGLHADVSRAKLDTIAKFYGLGAKFEGDLENTKGKRDLTKDELARLMAYCNNDNELCAAIFAKQIAVYPEDELRLIDLTVRMFCNSQLEVDLERAQLALAEEMIERRATILRSKVSEEVLQSNPKFADQLRKYGVEPPVKISLKTGHENYAFAQTDPEFLDLLDHEDIRVVRLAEARLAAKSTQMETRAARLIQAGQTGKLPAGYNYYAAKTGRWGGSNKLNLQNLPRVDKKNPRPSDGLRRSIIAPKGHVLVVADSAQIEARTLAWLAGQDDVTEAFRSGRDVYKNMASAIYGKPESSVTDNERFVGKVCLAEGTLIYSDRGWTPIESITSEHRLWDGEEWVCHQGLLNNGIRETLNLSGLWLTPDHLVLCGAEWKEAQYLERDANSLSQALATAAATLSSADIYAELAAALQRSSLYATAGVQSTPSISRILRTSAALGAPYAQSQQLLRSVIGVTPTLCPTTSTAGVYSTDWPQPLGDARTPATRDTNTMARAASPSGLSGWKIAQHFSGISSAVLAGTTQAWRWIAKTTVRAMSLATCVSSLAPRTPATSAGSKTLRRKSNVYDVLSVGPRNRFLALTADGPVVVHNCVLGLGYGMGPKKFQTTLALGTMGAPVQITANEASRIVKLYRSRNARIGLAWKEADLILRRMIMGSSGDAFDGVIEFDPHTIWLPNGMGIHYPGLHISEHEAIKYNSNGVYKKVYGGLVVENIVQALARIIVGEQALLIKDDLDKLALKRAEIACINMLTHDEVVSVVPERHAGKVLKMKIKHMSTPRAWCPDLPVGAEGKHDRCYSK